MTTHKWLCLTLALTFVASFALACGPGIGDGYSECGGETCAPGQYCVSPQLGVCQNGCTSDVNCLSGSVCTNIDDVTGEGTCSESEAQTTTQSPPPPPPPADSLAACKAAVDDFQSCGLPASDAAQWRADCEQLNENQQIVVSNCREHSCSSQPGCLGIDCFNDAHCGAEEQCVGNSCL